MDVFISCRSSAMRASKHENAQMQNHDIIRGLWKLACSSTKEGRNSVTESRIIDVLDALISSNDTALMELIPIFLSLSEQMGVSTDLSPLVDKYGKDSPQSIRVS